jgi:hypothetical protein
MRQVAVGIAIGLAGLAVIAFMLLKPGWALPNTGSSLGSSLARALVRQADYSQAGAGCVRQTDRDWWYCETSFDPGSGYSNPSRPYKLEAKTNGCWTAHRMLLRHYRMVAVASRTISGCVSIGDYIVPHDVSGGSPTALKAPPP